MTLAPFKLTLHHHLNDDATAAEYLNAALNEYGPDDFMSALRDVAEARGVTLPDGDEMSFAAVMALVKEIGLEVRFAPTRQAV